MFKKTKEYTFEELIDIFCKEREGLRNEFFQKVRMFEVVDYFFDKWIESARACKNVDEFDSMIRESLRMSFQEWFDSLP